MSEENQHELAARVLKQNPQRFVLIMRNAAQRRFDVTPDPLGPTRTRVSVIVSQPIRHVLIFDDHPATIRLWADVDFAEQRKDKLAPVEIRALIVLLILAMLWPLL